MKRFIPPSVPFTEKWSIEMKKVLSVVSLIMGIVPFSLLFIWKQEFMRQSPVNYIVIGGVVIVIGAGFVIALYQFKSRHFRDLVTKMALILNSLPLEQVWREIQAELLVPLQVSVTLELTSNSAAMTKPVEQ